MVCLLPLLPSHPPIGAAADSRDLPRVVAELHPSPIKSQVCRNRGHVMCVCLQFVVSAVSSSNMNGVVARPALAECFEAHASACRSAVHLHTPTCVCVLSSNSCDCRPARRHLQAAAAATVVGVGLGVMPLTSLALGLDPGFISLGGERHCDD